ncbi:MAG: SAM-dependent methyltransferase [Acidobacteriaceae bacterium]
MSTGRAAAVLESSIGSAKREKVGLEEYYSEAGPDYAAWSRDFNMHFGYYRWGMNPFDREPMLEQMNAEVLERLRIDSSAASRILDLGCGLGATLRSMARRLPLASLTGVTRVPWQVEQARERNAATPQGERIEIDQLDYEKTGLASACFDAAYAIESACYAHGADKAAFLQEAHRLLRPGGRLVIVDGFLRSSSNMPPMQRRIFDKLCECWVIESWGELERVQAQLDKVGFRDIRVEECQFRVAPSVFHIPWVTLEFLIRDVLCGERKMTRARWNNVLAPVLLPLVSMPLGPMVYCVVTATKS